jgi:site-specific DNA-cytosine methylase
VYFVGNLREESRPQVFPLGRYDEKNPKKSKEVKIADWRSDEGLRIRKNGISPTLTLATPPYIINGNIRKITPVEAARLQGFPDDWNDCQSDSQRYKQYGNAITVNLAESIFRKLYEE